jgi:hypothetical protein
MTRNIPVPAGPRAPLSLRWLWWTGPPALITWLYRSLIPARIRGVWGIIPVCYGMSLGWKSDYGRSGVRVSNSHLALAAILAGGGWAAFLAFGIPCRRTEANNSWGWPESTY